MNYSGGGAEPAAASCRSQFRESLASYPYSAAASHKGLLWAAASCRSQFRESLASYYYSAVASHKGLLRAYFLSAWNFFTY